MLPLCHDRKPGAFGTMLALVHWLAAHDGFSRFDLARSDWPRIVRHQPAMVIGNKTSHPGNWRPVSWLGLLGCFKVVG